MESRETTAPVLLREARCAAFGAPMCYGAAEGHEIRKDLATFIQDRTAPHLKRRRVLIDLGGLCECWRSSSTALVGAGPGRFHEAKAAKDLLSAKGVVKRARYAISWFQGKVSSLSMRILDYAAGGLAQKAQDGIDSKIESKCRTS